jgi:hypothetical protein
MLPAGAKVDREHCCSAAATVLRQNRPGRFLPG